MPCHLRAAGCVRAGTLAIHVRVRIACSVHVLVCARADDRRLVGPATVTWRHRQAHGAGAGGSGQEFQRTLRTCVPVCACVLRARASVNGECFRLPQASALHARVPARTCVRITCLCARACPVQIMRVRAHVLSGCAVVALAVVVAIGWSMRLRVLLNLGCTARSLHVIV